MLTDVSRSGISLFFSASQLLECGVPQGSSLSPTLFNIYVKSLADLVDRHGLSLVSYADDSQPVISVSEEGSNDASRLKTCLEEVVVWMGSSCLKLNCGKTEVLLLGNNRAN